MDSVSSEHIQENANDIETISACTWDKMKRSMSSAGFREGASVGWDLAFQNGFDYGYTQGYSDAFMLGVLKGVMSVTQQGVLSDAHKKDHALPDDILKKCSAGICQRCKFGEVIPGDVTKVASSQELFSQAVLNDLAQNYSGILKEHDIVFPT